MCIKMQGRTVLLVLLACSGCFRLAKANSIACETTSVGASCKPWNGKRGCDGNDRITHTKESDRCWPSGRSVPSIDLESFRETKMVGSCPNQLLNYGDCVDAVGLQDGIISAHRQVEDLEIKYEPVNLFSYNITVRWTYNNNNPSPDGVKAYRLEMTGGPEIQSPYNCVCINSSLNLTEYTVTVDYGESVEPLTANMFTFPHVTGIGEDAFEVETSRKAPTTCADYETGLPYNIDACGLPLYGKPRNVNMEQNGTSTVLSWEKPCFKNSEACDLFDHGLSYISPEVYYLTLTDNNQYFKVSNATEVTLNTSYPLHVKVFAYVPCSGLYEYHDTSTGQGNGCSISGEVDEDKLDEATCCSFLSPTAVSTSTFMSTPTPSPSSTPSTTSSSTHIYALAIVVVLIPILAAALCGIMILWCHRRPNTRATKGYGHPSPDRDSNASEPSVSVPPVSVLVIFSPRTPQLETQTIMHCLVAVLRKDYYIESQIPDLHLPRENIFDWIEEHHEKADVVLCVCNKYFYEEWNQTANLENHLKVVYCIKTLFQRVIDSDKYAVVLTDSNDYENIPPLLGNRKTFSITDYDGIARFARNIPRLAGPIPAAAIP